MKFTKTQAITRKKVEALAVRADRVGIHNLEPEEQVAVVAFATRGIVGNGGMEYFYQGEIPLSTLIHAYEALGLHDIVAAARATASLFPDPKLADDPVARQDHLEGLTMRPQTKVFVRLEWEQLFDAIGAYWAKKLGN